MRIIMMLLVVIVANFSTFAQDPQLFENDWYLEKVVIDGEDFFPPYPSDEIERGRVYFNDSTNELFTSYCDDLTFQIINYEIDNVFNLSDDPMILPGFCILEENTTYSSIYGSVFRDQATNTAKNPFNYSLLEVNDVTTLTITNGNGDIAVFGNEFLSSQDVINTSVSIYPNPVKNTLQISSENNITIKAVEVYDVLGKQLLQTNGMNQIDVSNLATGMLFLKITTDKGVLVKKIVKE